MLFFMEIEAGRTVEGCLDNCAGRLAQKDSHPDSLQHKMRLVYYYSADTSRRQARLDS